MPYTWGMQERWRGAMAPVRAYDDARKRACSFARKRRHASFLVADWIHDHVRILFGWLSAAYMPVSESGCRFRQAVNGVGAWRGELASRCSHGSLCCEVALLKDLRLILYVVDFERTGARAIYGALMTKLSKQSAPIANRRQYRWSNSILDVYDTETMVHLNLGLHNTRLNSRLSSASFIESLTPAEPPLTKRHKEAIALTHGSGHSRVACAQRKTTMGDLVRRGTRLTRCKAGKARWKLHGHA